MPLLLSTPAQLLKVASLKPGLHASLRASKQDAYAFVFDGRTTKELVADVAGWLQDLRGVVPELVKIHFDVPSDADENDREVPLDAIRAFFSETRILLSGTAKGPVFVSVYRHDTCDLSVFVKTPEDYGSLPALKKPAARLFEAVGRWSQARFHGRLDFVLEL